MEPCITFRTLSICMLHSYYRNFPKIKNKSIKPEICARKIHMGQILFIMNTIRMCIYCFQVHSYN